MHICLEFGERGEQEIKVWRSLALSGGLRLYATHGGGGEQDEKEDKDETPQNINF